MWLNLPRQHVANIIRAVMKTLIEDVPATYFDLLPEMDRGLLMGYAAAFADPISQLKLSRILEDKPLQFEWLALSPLEMLKLLAEAVVQLGRSPEHTYDSIYILVDRVDEATINSRAAVALLKPLVAQRPLLEVPNVAFKFFLPFVVGEELRQTVDLRPDRLCVRTITWNHDALKDVIQQRLVYYSDDKVMRLEDICTAAARGRVVDRLIDACEGSPRTLLRLCHALIRHHVTRTDDTLIDTVDISQTLVDFMQQLDREQISPTITSQDAVPFEGVSGEPPTQGLHLDASGHVWVDGERLVPPLSKQEFEICCTLSQCTGDCFPG